MDSFSFGMCVIMFSLAGMAYMLVFDDPSGLSVARSTVLHADCRSVLELDFQYDFIFADPPFNIGIRILATTTSCRAKSIEASPMLGFQLAGSDAMGC